MPNPERIEDPELAERMAHAEDPERTRASEERKKAEQESVLASWNRSNPLYEQSAKHHERSAEHHDVMAKKESETVLKAEELAQWLDSEEAQQLSKDLHEFSGDPVDKDFVRSSVKELSKKVEGLRAALGY